jgi:hypothetical protein
MSNPVAKKVSDIDPVFEDQVLQQRLLAGNDYQNLASSGYKQRVHPMPAMEGWSGDLFDWDGMSEPFSRKQSNQWFLKAIDNAQAPGVSGDIVLTTTQVDYLACMERAFRARYTNSFPRVMAHTLGRRRGHGDEKNSLYIVGVLQYARGITQQSIPQ